MKHMIQMTGDTPKLLGQYKNGNYYVQLFSDGTKIRIQPNDEEGFVPAFAENCDVKITDRCDGGCPFCYEGCTPEGKHGELLNLPLWNSLHPFTELAINGNDLSHPQLKEFLVEMDKRSIIINMTVNQKHFMKYGQDIVDYVTAGYIHGIGISLTNPTDDFLYAASLFPNAVIHTIAGITTPEQYQAMYDKDLKVLILGYKTRGRGQQYFSHNVASVLENQLWLEENLKDMVRHFKVVSFDNLALEQLRIKESGILTDEQWNEFYMGDDGNYTFYIDLVAQTFAKNSISDERYPLLNNIDKMFQQVRNHG